MSENPDIKNVAISGAYSAGKSSVLASYKKNHRRLRFLHISLVHFQSPSEGISFRGKNSKSAYTSDSIRSESDKQDYAERRQAIENRLNNKILDLEEEIFRLKQELILMQSKSLDDIITRDNISTIFSITSTNEIGVVTDFNEIKSSEYFDLLKYLIRNEYIDETYADYMTYFYENSLSRIDKTFLRSVTDRKAKEYTYQ